VATDTIAADQTSANQAAAIERWKCTRALSPQTGRAVGRSCFWTKTPPPVNSRVWKLAQLQPGFV